MAQARRVKEWPGLDLGPVQLLFCCILSRNILCAGPSCFDLARQSGISWAAVMARDAGGDVEAGGGQVGWRHRSQRSCQGLAILCNKTASIDFGA